MKPELVQLLINRGCNREGVEACAIALSETLRSVSDLEFYVAETLRTYDLHTEECITPCLSCGGTYPARWGGPANCDDCAEAFDPPVFWLENPGGGTWS